MHIFLYKCIYIGMPHQYIKKKLKRVWTHMHHNMSPEKVGSVGPISTFFFPFPPPPPPPSFFLIIYTLNVMTSSSFFLFFPPDKLPFKCYHRLYHLVCRHCYTVYFSSISNSMPIFYTTPRSVSYLVFHISYVLCISLSICFFLLIFVSSVLNDFLLFHYYFNAWSFLYVCTEDTVISQFCISYINTSYIHAYLHW